MSDKIILVCCGEMGRTPKINGNAGRDHYPGVYSLVMAGGGWRHGSHINVFKRQKLNSLYLSVLQRLGVKTRKFNTVETSFTGLK